jgi:hypothetical protein
MLISLEDLNTKDIGSEIIECEAVVDLEGELVISMEEIDRLKEKKRKEKKNSYYSGMRKHAVNQLKKFLC